MLKNIFRALPLKIAASIGVAVLSIFGLSGCAGPASADPTNLNGTWVSVADNSSPVPSFVAEVKDGTILINMTMSNDTGLYWSGTFESSAVDTHKITSVGNVEHMKTSLFGSSAKTKEFTYEGGSIRFTFSIMGVSHVVELEKNSSSTN